MLEGVVNALIHRNYLEIGSEVHIDMFDDRIEIYSPGGMVSGISLEGKNLLKIPSKRRNPILADIFSRLKYMERRGNGFKKILADYEGQVEFDETKMPVFDADNDDFTLTLYNLNYGTNYATHVNENVIENVIEISEEKIKIWDIVRLIRLKVITYDDLSDFSDELQNEVKRILEMSR